MSVAQIQEAVASIKYLPANERIHVAHWTISEVEHEAEYAAFDQACEAGLYQSVIDQAEKDYREANVLTSIY